MTSSSSPPSLPPPSYPLAARLILLAAIGGAIGIALALNRPPSPKDSSAPPIDFSATRAREHLRAIAKSPRPVGSEAHREAREHIVRALRSHGLEPQVQQVQVATSAWGRRIPGGVVRNIIATLPGTERALPVLLTSHYDSVAAGPGASDDGAAVAAMLETLRALRAGPSLKNDVIFLFTDAEELGLVGAQAFVDGHPLAGRIGVALNFEARGSSGPVHMFETSAENGWLIKELAASAPFITASSLSVEVYRRMPNDTDFTVLRRKGISGMNFAYIGSLRHYHSESDTIENLDLGSLQHHGDYMLSLTRRLGDADLRQTRAPDAIYFNLIGGLFIHYSSQWVWPLLTLAAASVLGALVHGVRRGRLRAARVAGGLGVLLANTFVSAALITLLSVAIRALDPRFQQQHGHRAYDNSTYLIAFTALAAAIGASSILLAARREAPQELGAGALIGWLLLAAAAALWMPGASYLFAWPVLFGSAGVWALLLAHGSHRMRLRQAVLLAASSIPSIFLLVPTIQGMFMALSLLASGSVAAFIALLVGLLSAPLAVALRRARASIE